MRSTLFVLILITFIHKSLQDRKIYGYTDFNNTYFETGLQVLSNPINITENILLPHLVDRNVQEVSLSEFHSVYRTLGGELFGSGSNLNGQLGVSPTIMPFESYQRITDDITVTSACAMGSAFDGATPGRGTTLYLTNTNKLYSLGSNKYGNLGIGEVRDATGQMMDFYKPRRVFQQGALLGKTIKRVKCGLETAFALTTDGRLFAWGHNGRDVYASGVASIEESIFVPTQVYAVDDDDSVAEIYPGYLNGFILSANGKIYGFGRGISGEFGTDWGAATLFFPTELTFFLSGTTKHIAPGKHYTLILSEDNNNVQYLYGFGDASGSRYGVNITTTTPQLITLPNVRIATVEAGYESSYLITAKGDVYVTGTSTHLVPNGTFQYTKVTEPIMGSAERTISLVRAKKQVFFVHKVECGIEMLDSDYSVCSGKGQCIQKVGSADGYCSCNAGYSNKNGQMICEICAAGHYREETDLYSSTCTQCPFGTYNPTAGASAGACISCPAGHFTRHQGSTSLQSCESCPSGHYINENKDGCLPCPMGTFSTVVGASSNATCLLCELGSFNEEEGKDKCTMCPGGSVTHDRGSISLNNCTACHPGEYSHTENGITTCQKCPAGTYNHITGATSLAACRSCAAGTYQPDFGAPSEDNCIKCPKGTYSTTQSAEFITACKPCELGTYNDQLGGSNILFCVECPVGTYGGAQGLAAKSECTPCPRGSYGPTPALKSEGECILCDRFSYQDQVGQTSCQPCLSGSMTAAVGANSSTLCLPCGKGTYFMQVNDTMECYPCPAGTYSENEYATSLDDCIPCRAGTYSEHHGAPSEDSCLLCPGGHYSPLVGANSSLACQECPDNSFALNGSASCIMCPPGHVTVGVLANGESTCSAAPPGFYTANNHLGVLSIFPCPVGTYSNETAAEGVDVCKSCPSGFYAPSTNSTSCTRTREGYYQPNVRQFVELECPPGTFQNETGQANCKSCANGHFSTQNASTSCTPSEPGFYVPINARANQLPCPQGEYQDEEAKTSCKSCANGHFSSQNASTSCTPSEPGFYVPINARANQLPCPQGEYQDEEAKTSCKPCEKGHFASNNGSTLCTPADPGYYVPGTHSSSQTPCPPGEFTNNTNADSCEKCPSGTFSDQNSTTECQQTRPGYYQSSSGQTEEIPCDEGKYQDDYGMDDCKLCPLGHYAPQQATTNCTPSSIGYFVNVTGSSVQYEAPQGTYVDQQGSDSVTLCPQNTYRDAVAGTSVDACTVCSPGSYSLENGATTSSTCESCMTGYICEGTRDTPHPFRACPAGTYNSYESQSTFAQCITCPLGNYCEEHASEPTACPVGYYQDAYGAANFSFCTPCSPGSYSTDEASQSSSTCIPCPPGHENPLFGQDRCVSCNEGYYAPVAGFVNCRACEPGFYMPKKNATACLSCPTGTASSMNASTSVKNCIPCPMGTFAHGLNSSDCEICAGGICPTGSSAVLPVVKQFLEPVIQIINPQNDLTASASGQSTLVKWIPIGVVSLLCIVFLLLVTCVSLCLHGCRDPCRLFATFDMFFKLHHHVKLHDSPVKKRTIIGGLLSIIACVVIFCFVYSSAVDLFMNNTFLSETFRIGEIQTSNGTAKTINRYRGTLWIFGNHPECSTFQATALGFVGNAPVNGTCEPETMFEGVRVDSCRCRWECIDCSHEGVSQRMIFNAPGIFSNILAYELSVPHYLTEPDSNIKRFYTINGTVLPPPARIFYGLPDRPVHVYFSIFNSQYIKQSSMLSIITSLVEFFGVMNQETGRMTGLTSQLLSIAAGDTAEIKENDDKDKGLYVMFNIELSAFIFLLEERSIQTSLNFIAQVAALSSLVLTMTRLFLMGFEMFILQFWMQKFSRTKKKHKKGEVDDIELDAQEFLEDEDVDGKKLSVSNQSVFGGNSQKIRFLPLPETAVFTSDSIFADDIMLATKGATKSVQPASRVLERSEVYSKKTDGVPESPSASSRKKKRRDTRKPVFHDCRLLTVTQQYQLNEWYGMKRQEWDLAYRATKHGFQGKDFHQRIDGRGPTFTVIKTREGYIFGGFLQPDWTSSNTWIRAPSNNDAWLFSVFNPEFEKAVKAGDDIPDPVHIPCVDVAKAAFGGQFYGPIFGAGNDIFCSNMSNENQNSNTNLGKSYQTSKLTHVSAVSQKYLCGAKNFTVEEIECFILHVK